MESTKFFLPQGTSSIGFVWGTKVIWIEGVKRWNSLYLPLSLEGPDCLPLQHVGDGGTRVRTAPSERCTQLSTFRLEPLEHLAKLLMNLMNQNPSCA